MLACHDLRTPLATVHGFAHTLARSEDLDGTTARYVEMINAAAAQLAELIDDLSVSARLAGDRYDPPLQTVDTMELAQAAAERLGDERVLVSGEGADVELDAETAERAISSLARCALRHGGLERVEIAAEGSTISIAPVTEAAPILLGEELKDLGAAAARRLIEACGGSLAVEDERLLVRLPT
jgi:signal transduction histidine kinase